MGIVERFKPVINKASSSIKKDKDFVEKASLKEKVEKAKEVIRAAYERFPHDKIVLAWTGGKDSTLILWLIL
ncbi:hypothetical protein GTO10_00975, partial [Candidatus Saccharibacteria bacterium]|nr:hypothetical protein [Candidatus Saccharibacteria bacterium]